MAYRGAPNFLVVLVAACGPGHVATIGDPQTSSSDTQPETSSTNDPTTLAPTTGASTAGTTTAADVTGPADTSGPDDPSTTTAPDDTSSTAPDDTSSTSTATGESSTGDPVECDDPIHEGDLVITDETPLAQLECLTEITGALRVEKTKTLTEFKALAGVHTIGDGVRISDNAALVDLDGLAGLKHVHCITLGACFARIDVEYNPALTSVQGLAALETADAVDLHHNLALASLAGVTLGWDPFEADRPSLMVSGLEALLDFEGIASTAPFSGGLVIVNNSNLVDISQLGPHLAAELTWVTISGNFALMDLAGLEGVTAMKGLALFTDDALTDLAPLADLTDIGVGGLEISNLEGLTSLHGLEQLEHTGFLRLEHNHALKSLAALSGLKVVDEDLTIGDCFPLSEGNDVLVSLAGLEGLQTAPILKIHENAALADIDALLGLDGAATLAATHNPALDSLAVDALAQALGIAPADVLNCENAGNPGPCECFEPLPP